jgi:hypothetical protein
MIFAIRVSGPSFPVLIDKDGEENPLPQSEFSLIEAISMRQIEMKERNPNRK